MWVIRVLDCRYVVGNVCVWISRSGYCEWFLFVPFQYFFPFLVWLDDWFAKFLFDLSHTDQYKPFSYILLTSCRLHLQLHVLSEFQILISLWCRSFPHGWFFFLFSLSEWFAEAGQARDPDFFDWRTLNCAQAGGDTSVEVFKWQWQQPRS